MSCTGTAARIRSFRVRAGKSKLEVAHALGLNEAWYEDIEKRDAELVSTLTLFQAMQLASLFGVTLYEFFERARPEQRIALMELPRRIEAHLARRRIGLEKLEGELGWDLGPVMDSPVQAAAEFPIAFLEALAETLGLNWLSFVPD